jgi:Rrf2 family nitric oxide-sensitive transcriptional repressor
MRISKTTHNALQILIATARSGTNLVKGAAIAHELDLTEQNTSKIVHLLSRGGFIKAVRGPQGGMKLAQRPEDIRIGDVVLAMERMSIEDERASGTGDFSRIFDVALEAFVSVLNQHTLADMVRNKRSSFLASLSSKPAKSKSKAANRKAAAIPDFVRSERTVRAKPRGVPK